jgi:hypothetical protein
VQHVIAGQRLNGERGSDIERDVVRQSHQHGGSDDHLLRVGAALFDKGGDTLADFHPTYARPELRNRSGDLKPEHQRVGARVRVDAGADLRIRPVAPGESDIHQNLAGTGLGLGHIGDDELFGRTGRVNDDGFHCCLLYHVRRR